MRRLDPKSAVFLCAAALNTGCRSPARGFCDAAAACNEAGAVYDVVGESDDSVDVCVAQVQGTLDTLRANAEPVCAKAADKYQGFLSCVAAKSDEGEHCAGLRPLNTNECDSELKDFDETFAEADGACADDA